MHRIRLVLFIIAIILVCVACGNNIETTVVTETKSIVEETQEEVEILHTSLDEEKCNTMDVGGIRFLVPIEMCEDVVNTKDDILFTCYKNMVGDPIKGTKKTVLSAEKEKMTSAQESLMDIELFSKAFFDSYFIEEDSSEGTISDITNIRQIRVDGIEGRIADFTYSDIYGNDSDIRMAVIVNNNYIISLMFIKLSKESFDFDIFDEIIGSGQVVGDGSENVSFRRQRIPVKEETEAREVAELQIIPKASFDAVKEMADSYKIEEVDDIDLEDGIRCKKFSDTDEEKQIEIVYRANDEAIICATVIAKPKPTEDEQRTFIQEISKVLCPPDDAEDVYSWIFPMTGLNIKSGKRTINDIKYELSKKAMSVVEYYVNVDKWEEWKG